jgi:hypothetical protein
VRGKVSNIIKINLIESGARNSSQSSQISAFKENSERQGSIHFVGSEGAVNSIKSLFSDEEKKVKEEESPKENRKSPNNCINNNININSQRPSFSNVSCNYTTNATDITSSFIPSNENSPSNILSTGITQITTISGNPNSPKKYPFFLKIKYDIFDNSTTEYLSKKILLINLKKTLLQVYKYLQLSHQPDKVKSTSFAFEQISMYNFKNNFDLFNNYSNELADTLIKNKTANQNMLQLYQLLSNNLDIKFSKFVEKNLSCYSKMYAQQIINDSYQILDLISKDPNGLWVMYKCRSLEDKGKVYTVKIIDKRLQKNLDIRQFLTYEFGIYARMSCKYVAQIKEIISSNFNDYIIMEYFDHNIFDYFMNKKNVEIEKIWKLIRNLISVIDYCHNVAKVAHRNLNFYNIFVCEKDLSLKITDFSNASILDEDKEIFFEGGVNVARESKEFIPPDYFDKNYPGQSLDLWACGVILYFMIYKTPFDNKFEITECLG